MRRSKEIVVLLVLFAALSVFVLWYVGQRRAENRARAKDPAARRELGPFRPDATAPVVDLRETDRKTIDFSSGQPVVKDTAADRAALEQGLKDIEEARKNVTFEAPAPKPAPAAAPEPKKP